MNKGIEIGITDCGDLALLVPLSLTLAIVLWRYQSRAAAFVWLQSFAFCMLVTLALKVAFLTCSQVWGLSMVSPSGHASMSSIVYGALSIVVALHMNRLRYLVVLLGAFLIGAIAITRVSLGAHNQAEVEIGLAVGLVSVFIFYWRYVRMPRLNIKPSWAWIGATCILAGMYGAHLPVELYLRQFAHSVDAQGRFCRTAGVAIMPRADYGAAVQ